VRAAAKGGAPLVEEQLEDQEDEDEEEDGFMYQVEAAEKEPAL
jgi:hypothetical protein